MFMLILSLASGCQQDKSPSIPVASGTPPPAPPTEAPTPTSEQPTISAPQGKPLAIDGTMSPGEWDSAGVETFSEGSELFLT